MRMSGDSRERSPKGIYLIIGRIPKNGRRVHLLGYEAYSVFSSLNGESFAFFSFLSGSANGGLCQRCPPDLGVIIC